MKKILSILLALVMMFGALSFSNAEESVTVSIALSLNTNVIDYQTNWYTQLLSEHFGVNVEIMPMDDVSQKLAIMVSSGTELPDMICNGLSDATVWNWAQQGVLVPLTEYWNDPEMTKNVMSRLNDFGCDETMLKEILGNVTMPDGEIYTLPIYDEALWNLSIYRMRINSDWLEKAGMDVPQTIDELKDFLIYCRDNDMNGNGDTTDEIPLTGSTGWGCKIVPYLMGAFIHANPDVNYINVEDGKIIPAYTQDAYREGLEYLHEMYEEGLIDPLAFTQDGTQMKAAINGDELKVGMVVAASDSNFTNELSQSAYQIIGPVEGPNGVRVAAAKPGTVSGKVYITSYADDPALCFKMAEINYSTEWRGYFRHGEYGVNWTDDPEVISQYKPTFVGADLTGRKYVTVDIDDVWGKVQNVIWGDELMPYIQTQDIVTYGITTSKIADLTEEELNKPSNMQMHYELYHEYVPAEMPGNLVYTTEENERLAEIKSAIYSYANEMTNSFIVGNASLDSWDDFQAQLVEMGIEEYIEIMQAAYDRKIG